MLYFLSMRKKKRMKVVSLFTRYILVLICTILMLGSLYGQVETVGFQYNQNFRDIDTLSTSSSIWSFNYRYDLPTNTRISASLGLDNVNLYEDGSSNDPYLKSSNQIFLQVEVLQVLYYFYLKGAAQYYKIKGNAYEATSSFSEVRHHNDYDMFEFPISAGLTLPTKHFDIFIGANKTFLYGSNKKQIFVNNSGTETSLGSASRQTFKTDLDIGIEGSFIYHITPEIDIELDGIMYSNNDFSLRLSVWGPLKRMYYSN